MRPIANVGRMLPGWVLLCWLYQVITLTIDNNPACFLMLIPTEDGMLDVYEGCIIFQIIKCLQFTTSDIEYLNVILLNLPASIGIHNNKSRKKFP